MSCGQTAQSAPLGHVPAALAVSAQARPANPACLQQSKARPLAPCGDQTPPPPPPSARSPRTLTVLPQTHAHGLFSAPLLGGQGAQEDTPGGRRARAACLSLLSAPLPGREPRLLRTCGHFPTHRLPAAPGRAGQPLAPGPLFCGPNSLTPLRHRAPQLRPGCELGTVSASRPGPRAASADSTRARLPASGVGPAAGPGGDGSPLAGLPSPTAPTLCRYSLSTLPL